MNRFLRCSTFVLVAGPVTAFAVPHDTPSLAVSNVGQAKVALAVAVGPSGAPAGFRIQWITGAEFVANGWSSPQEADFTGSATLNLWGGTTFTPEGNAVVTVEIGDLFDETGLTATALDELSPETAYVFRALVNGDATNEASGWSQEIAATTQTLVNCVRTQGYWKNHPEAWSGPITIAGISYTQAELLAIFGTPAQGNGLISLAHQVIATKINLLAGASSGPIAATLAAAEALISSSCGLNPIPTIGTCSIHPSTTSSYTEGLDNYNNGASGVPHCDAVDIDPATWGEVKSIYR
ncbi:MAG: hypothetical protein ACT4PE_00100 [Candidatus Eiseniibacteriota bacterium]